MQTKSPLTALMTVLALGAACVSQSAFAASEDIASVKVQYADLNLSSPAGAQAMLQRIRHAANTVCGAQPTSKIDQASRLYDQRHGSRIGHADGDGALFRQSRRRADDLGQRALIGPTLRPIRVVLQPGPTPVSQALDRA